MIYAPIYNACYKEGVRGEAEEESVDQKEGREAETEFRRQEVTGAPPGAAPLDPACFWIEDPSWNRLAFNGIFSNKPYQV